jgi:hypothetical protein
MADIERTRPMILTDGSGTEFARAAEFLDGAARQEKERGSLPHAPPPMPASGGHRKYIALLGSNPAGYLNLGIGQSRAPARWVSPLLVKGPDNEG